MDCCEKLNGASNEQDEFGETIALASPGWALDRRTALKGLAGLAGGASWCGSAPTTVFGRPGCAAIPLAIGGPTPSLSFGCAGMRTFTEIGDDRMLAIIPGAKLAGFTAALTKTRGVNDGMESFYQQRKAAVVAPRA